MKGLPSAEVLLTVDVAAMTANGPVVPAGEQAGEGKMIGSSTEITKETIDRSDRASLGMRGELVVPDLTKGGERPMSVPVGVPTRSCRTTHRSAGHGRTRSIHMCYATGYDSFSF